ncbi:MAG: hypothetical protein OJF60_002928 [Burkholderiaceae bacterium]|jgi:predicted MFS family arabinose efflux permease|nr:MAG: hypothetical protein OJF60_002928 [Burkholderiaceae bacterium]
MNQSVSLANERGMNDSVGKGGAAVLVVGHLAGMVDMVALPLWVGTLMQAYRFTPQTAGLTVTLFLLFVALTSMALSPLFPRLPRRVVAACGYLLAACCFYIAVGLSEGADLLPKMLALHALAGVGVGAGLSMTHGGMGRTKNPHRMFAIANSILGVFAVGFLGLMPHVIQSVGGHSIFLAFTAIMLVAAVVYAFRYPRLQTGEARQSAPVAKIPRAAWFAIVAVVFLTLNYAMVFSFIERVGVHRGFGANMVAGVLLTLGLVNLVPGPLAALLDRKFSAVSVAVVVPVIQALLALVIFNALDFKTYAVAAVFCVVPAMFGHIFLFGLISKLDPSGRAPASTPAMVMTGSSIGPLLGGTLVQAFGYTAVGAASVVIACAGIAAACLIRLQLRGMASVREAV